MMRIMEEQGHSSAPLAKSTKSGNDGGIGPFVHDDQIRILYHLLRVETGGVIAAGGKLRIGIAESRKPSLAVVSHQIGKAPAIQDRKSVVEGKSVSVRLYLGCRRLIKKNKTLKKHNLN